MHRPQWTLHVIWSIDSLAPQNVDDLPGHPALHDAATMLAKHVDPDLNN